MTFETHYYDGQTTKGEMGRTCSTYERDEKCTENFAKKLKGREGLQDTGADTEQNTDVEIKEQGARMWNGWNWHGYDNKHISQEGAPRERRATEPPRQLLL